MQKRVIVYISDGTGITAETLGHSLITQFESIAFESLTLPFIDTTEKAKDAIKRINQIFDETQQRPIIFATLIDKSIAKMIKESKGILFEFFNVFLEPLSKELQCEFSHSVGKSHGVKDRKAYLNKIDSINFTPSCDDGLGIQYYPQADIILMGVSRSGKTPTCLYLALQYGIRAANFPIVEEDLSELQLPSQLIPYKDKLFGLTISPERLQEIRSKRRANSNYASFKQCNHEVQLLKSLYHQETIPFLDTTKLSIEEIASQILLQKGLKRHLI